MTSRELVRRAIEFTAPERLPFWQHVSSAAPDDVCDIWEMDRQQAGWFFDTPGYDDWGCLWEVTDVRNMGQVVTHPLADKAALADYSPPDPIRANISAFGALEGPHAEASRGVCVTPPHPAHPQ